MRISRIRLLGFKSFAQKTEFVLDPGITAIVGPNGCGKSNVIDAVKWVLGEQRPSALRAKEMMDVIFSGAGTRRPLGMAEVSIVFDNADGKLPFEMAEVVFTRRLYRSGESEYLLNGNDCRLRDLRESLMDTGSGLDAFSIMEQGRIDAILTANPIERRTVFEEAAGIGRYKARRKETIRRLGRIGDDLLRLRDVIEITEKQLRSLRYQASRAKRYRELTETLKKKRVTWALYRYHALLSDQQAVTERLVGIEAGEAEVNEQLRILLTGLGGEETEFESLGTKVRRAEADLMQLDADVRSLGDRAEHGRSMAGELADRVDWYAREIDLGKRRIAEMGEERGGFADELAALSAEATLRESELGKADDEIAAARAEEVAREAELRDLRNRRVAVIERRANLRNERAALKTRLETGATQVRKLESRRESLGEAGKGYSDRIGELGRSTEERQSVEDALKARLDEHETEAGGLEERVRDLREQHGESQRKISAGRSRLDLLKSMKARREGMGQAVKKILDEAAREGSELTGVRGVVADLIRVEEADAESVELALGACSQGIVIETTADAARAIGWLKEKKLGRALFIPLDEVREAGPLYTGSGGGRSADASVQAVEAEYAPLVKALLSDSVLVEDFEDARRMARDDGAALRIITGGGEVLNRIGAVTGGGGRSPAALVTRNVEIETLGTAMEEEDERREAFASALDALLFRQKEARSEIRALREEWDAAREETRNARGELSRIERDLARMAEEEHVLTVEIGELRDEEQTAGRRDAQLADEETVVLAEEEKLKTDQEAHEERFEAAREVSRETAGHRTQIEIARARSRERLTAAQSREQALARGIRDSEQAVQQACAEMESCGKRRDESLLDAEVAERESELAAKKRTKLVDQVSGLRKSCAAAREKLLVHRNEAGELREKHESWRSTLSEFRLKENETRIKLEGLLDRVRDEFELDLPELYAEFTPEEIDWDALDEEVTTLRHKVDRMGNVNLEALDQLAEVEEKVRFLHTEESDLLKSKETLMEILRKVNRESRERFEKAFSDIRENFRVMYRKLFGGGTADIQLAEGEDILEAGIEIMVKPPARDLVNLNLLSGGEKTLTAVALMFAIFKSRPSPFAIMDEVDAALDESNIDRFVRVLREFADESQFIIITHNKRTMAEADALYGVTMPEPGVSKPVSIRFNKPAGSEEAPPEAASRPVFAEAPAKS